MMRRKLGTGKLWILTGVFMLVAAVAMSGIYLYSREQSREETAQQKTQENAQTARAQEKELQKEAVENKSAEPMETDTDSDTEDQEQKNTDSQEKNKKQDQAEAQDQAEGAGAEDTSNVAAMIEANKAADQAEGADTADAAADQAEDTAKSQEDQEAQAAQASAAECHFSSDSQLVWPLAGNILMDYSMDATVYYATLQQYKYNPALIIQGDVNSKVTAAASGTVTEIATNEETGCTVTMDIGDGYTAVYGQLKELNCEEGSYVEAGALLGHVSEPTKYYSVEGSNLYFEVKKDGTPVDPMDHLQ